MSTPSSDSSSPPADVAAGNRFGRAFELAPVGSVERQIIDAAVDHVRVHGWSSTTMDDIAVASGRSRATLYRAFPGGRETVIDAVRRHLVLSFFHDLQPVIAAERDLVDAVAATMSAAARMLADDEQLQHDLEHDPGQVLPVLTFRGLDRILVVARVFLAPHLLAFTSRRDANRCAEWAARMVLTHALDPSAQLDLSDRETAADLVRRRLVPGLPRPPAPFVAVATSRPFTRVDTQIASQETN